MKPVLNLDELTEFEVSDNDKFGERYARVAEKIGAIDLGYSLSIVPPGKRACPFHNHRINEEMFLILEGTGTLRFGAEEYPLKPHDIIACPPGDRSVAHQIINTGDTELKYLSLSTNKPFEICEYPDSDKVLAWSESPGGPIRHITKLESSVDYFEGEL